MSASATIFPVNLKGAAPRHHFMNPREQRRKKDRTHQELIRVIADQTLAKLASFKYPLRQDSIKQFYGWIDEKVIDPARVKSPIARRHIARCAAGLLTKGPDGERMLKVVPCNSGRISLQVTDVGREYLLDRAKAAHPASGAIRTVRGAEVTA